MKRSPSKVSKQRNLAKNVSKRFIGLLWWQRGPGGAFRKGGSGTPHKRQGGTLVKLTEGGEKTANLIDKPGLQCYNSDNGS